MANDVGPGHVQSQGVRMLHQRMDPHPHGGREHMTTPQIGHGHIEVGSTRTSIVRAVLWFFFRFGCHPRPNAPKNS